MGGNTLGAWHKGYKLVWKRISERVGLGCVRRAALQCEEMPPASAADKVGAGGTGQTIAMGLCGDGGSKGPYKNLEKNQSVCPKGKAEL